MCVETRDRDGALFNACVETTEIKREYYVSIVTTELKREYHVSFKTRVKEGVSCVY